jgi:uncharacterized protein (DUF1810 family)
LSASPDDPHDLERFVAAQAGTYAQALAEVTHGRKVSHWMWFVFPQIAGLGYSAMARAYAIADADEARAYLAHPLLGRRLVEATNAVTATAPGDSAGAIMGGIDAVKLRSSLTLFAAVADDPAPFEAALARFFAGERDPETMRRL